MKTFIMLWLLAGCGGGTLPVVLGPDGGVIATCPDYEWCYTADGRRIGAP